MIIWFRHLPRISMDLVEWTPFIKNNFLRAHYMKFVYLLQMTIFLISLFFDVWSSSIHIFALISISIFIFIIHECLHILVINKKGDISLTFRGIFFWLHTNAVLSKTRYWMFMSLPLIALSVVPVIVSFYVSGDIKSVLLFVSWLNLLISGSDIINSFLIIIKPKNSVFCRGYYRVEKNQEHLKVTNLFLTRYFANKHDIGESKFHIFLVIGRLIGIRRLFIIHLTKWLNMKGETAILTTCLTIIKII